MKQIFGMPHCMRNGRKPDVMKPVSRDMLIQWVSTFKAQNEEDKLGVLDFKNALLWRLKDENLFPYKPGESE